jgi:hypothetical protein
MIAAITAGLQAIGEFFGWKKQKEINLPQQQKREEVQTARKDHEKNDASIDAWVDAGRLPKPSKDKADSDHL